MERKPLTRRKQAWANRFKPNIVRGKPLNPSTSVEVRYSAALASLIRRMTEETERAIVRLFLGEAAQEYFGEDAAPTGISAQAKVLTAALKKKFDKLFGDSAEEIARRFAAQSGSTSSTAVHASAQQLSGGLSLATRSLKGPLTEIMRASITENVALIKSIPQKYLGGVEGAVMRSITTGNGLQDLVPYLAKGKGITERRARMIAKDQTRKVFNDLSRGRMQRVGIKEAEWLHTGGSNHPRKSHVTMTGKIFDLSEGLYDPDVGKNVKPGELPNCRCRMVPVIRFEE